MRYMFLIFLVSLLVIAGFGYILNLTQTLQTENEHLNAEIFRLEEELRIRENALNQAAATIHDQQAQIESLTNDLATSQAETQAARADVTLLTEEITRRDEEIAALETQLKAAQDNLAQALAERDAARDEINALQTQIRDLEQASENAGVYPAAAKQAAPAFSQQVAAMLPEIEKEPLGHAVAAILIVFGGASTASLVTIYLKMTIRKRAAYLSDQKIRRQYHQLILQQRGRL